MWLRRSGEDLFWFDLSITLINVLFLGMAVYVNMYWLMPQYLAKKKALTYLLMVIILCVVVTPLKIMSAFMMGYSDPDFQALLIQNQPTLYLYTFLIVALSTVLKIIREWVKQQRIQQDLIRENLQSELRFLRSQINPHFLFNTLNSIYALSLKKSDQAPDMVLRLSELMRYVLYECNERTVSLDKEINYLNNYLELEKIRSGGKVEVSFDVKGITKDKYIAPMIFITFVENSFKHGLSRQIHLGYVHISIVVKNSELVFYIENSKSETHDDNYHQGGIGLQNTRRRLDIMYPGQYSMKIEDGVENYSVTLKIKLLP